MRAPDDGAPDAEAPDDEPDDVAPDDEPELPGVEPFEPGGVVGLVGDDGVVVVGDGVVEVDEDGGVVVVVDEPFGMVVCGLVVVELDGVDGVVGEGWDGLPPTSPPSEVVAPAGVDPPTIPDSGFFARASTAVTAAMDRPNAANVARAMLRQRRERTTRSSTDHSASMVAPMSRPFGPGAPGGGGGAPGPRPDGIGGGPGGPGGRTSEGRSRAGTSLVLSGSEPTPSTPVLPDGPPETRAPLPTRERTVVAGCFRTDGTVSLIADGTDCRRALRVDLIE